MCRTKESWNWHKEKIFKKIQWHTRIPGRDPEHERQDCAIQCFFRSIWSRIFHTYMHDKKYRSRLKSYLRLSFASKYLKVNYTTPASTHRENPMESVVKVWHGSILNNASQIKHCLLKFLQIIQVVEKVVARVYRKNVKYTHSYTYTYTHEDFVSQKSINDLSFEYYAIDTAHVLFMKNSMLHRMKEKFHDGKYCRRKRWNTFHCVCSLSSFSYRESRRR